MNADWRGKSQRLSYDFVYNYFLEHNCELLEKTYKNAQTKMKYRCECGNVSEICWMAFRKGSRCKQCGMRKTKEHQRLDPEYIKRFFQNHKCILLDEYVNSATPMRYICECGNESKIRFDDFKLGKRCRKCMGVRAREKTALSYEYVSSYFKQHGCELLAGSYINWKTKMKYKCSCGNISYITWTNFKNGNRCKACQHDRTSGENNPCWNPNLTYEDRLIGRNTPENHFWQKQVYKKNHYRCVLCGSKKKIRAHHLYGYSAYPDLRYDESNGVVLCKEHHVEFHKLYGYGNNTKEQFEEYSGSRKEACASF
jgi:hypothetical protein